MPPHRIHPPCLPEHMTPAQVAALLTPLKTERSYIDSIKHQSDEAMRLVLDAGLPINAAYQFTVQKHPRKSDSQP